MQSYEPENKLRVLLAGHLHPPVGGISAYCASLMNSSLSQRVDLHFVQTTSPSRPFTRAGKLTFANLFSAAGDCWRFNRAVAEFHPQIVHIATAFGWSFLKHSLCMLVAKLAGCRVLLHPHCSFQAFYTQQSPLVKIILHLCIRLADAILVLSSEWLPLKQILPSRHIYLLYNAIDLQPYLKAAAKRNLLNSHFPFQILYLGHIGKAKGSFLLVEAAKLLQQQGEKAIIRLVGAELTAGEIAALRREIEENHLQESVMIHSPVFGEEKINLFGQADIFVYPSFHEGIPIAVIEAMACGLPIIATAVGGLPDLVQDGINGLLITAGKAEELAGAITHLIHNEPLRRSMEKESIRRAVEQFEIENHVQDLVSIYYTLL